MHNNGTLTVTMEKYLEMIARMLQYNDNVSIKQLAINLNEKSSNAVKIINQLKVLEFIHFDKYGNIKPTNKGMVYGNYLLHRHEVLNKFFAFINSSSNELTQVEKIEHFIEERTLKNIEKLLERSKMHT